MAPGGSIGMRFEWRVDRSIDLVAMRAKDRPLSETRDGGHSVGLFAPFCLRQQLAEP
jgi:hypothetical protein